MPLPEAPVLAFAPRPAHAIAWRLLVTPPATGAENMALDEALMARARVSGEVVLRVYEWSRPTLSLGRHQSARGCYDEARARRAGIDFVRRPTGGRAVLHHRELTYSVTAPDGALGTRRESYARINRLLLAGLGRLGIAATAVTASVALAPGSTPCFAMPAAGEIVAGGRKLIGSAQWREGGGLLQHGSVLVDDDQHQVAELLRQPAATPLPGAATLRGLLGRAPSAAEFASALGEALIVTGTADSADLGPLAVDPALARAAAAARGRYTDPAWTWRR